jgi:roadblock/LC7 domain-containing protein
LLSIGTWRQARDLFEAFAKMSFIPVSSLAYNGADWQVRVGEQVLGSFDPETGQEVA